MVHCDYLLPCFIAQHKAFFVFLILMLLVPRRCSKENSEEMTIGCFNIFVLICHLSFTHRSSYPHHALRMMVYSQLTPSLLLLLIFLHKKKSPSSMILLPCLNFPTQLPLLCSLWFAS